MLVYKRLKYQFFIQLSGRCFELLWNIDALAGGKGTIFTDYATDGPDDKTIFLGYFSTIELCEQACVEVQTELWHIFTWLNVHRILAWLCSCQHLSFLCSYKRFGKPTTSTYDFFSIVHAESGLWCILLSLQWSGKTRHLAYALFRVGFNTNRHDHVWYEGTCSNWISHRLW